ncbi:MAG: DUF485 domain-containing protein [Candidatus Omnitrophota bacterium]|jgi:uncharacterized membrane protein (DUF485 family)|nr:MAG: DUF485 domain-containing protein [Candidatus Omnitrophota bacterium]
MLHEPAIQSGKDLAVSYKMRIGVRMFIVYAILYGGFVVLNVMKPVVMETPVILGMNLAVFYGFGLIVFALILALVYTILCSRKEKEFLNESSNGGNR